MSVNTTTEKRCAIQDADREATHANWAAKELIRGPMEVVYREGRLKLTQEGRFLLEITKVGFSPHHDGVRWRDPEREVKFLSKEEAASWLRAYVSWTDDYLSDELKALLKD